MLDVLRAGLAAHAIDNIDIIEGRWPDLACAAARRADVALMAHVGYDIEEPSAPSCVAAEACAPATTASRSWARAP